MEITLNGETRRHRSRPSVCAGLLEQPGARSRQARGGAQPGDCAALNLRPGERSPMATGLRLCISSAAAMRPWLCRPRTSRLIIAGKKFKSRLIIGTGKYKAYAENPPRSKPRRRDRHRGGAPGESDRPQPTQAGGFHRSQEIHVSAQHRRLLYRRRRGAHLRLAREAGGWTLVKLEVLGEKKLLYPDMIETLRATECCPRTVSR